MILLVGDVQGCDEALGRLLSEAGFTPSRDRLVVLGDLVNRGPGSLAVLQRLAGLGDAARCVLGNHDLHLLAVLAARRAAGRGDSLDEILASPDRARWADWLRHQPLALEESGWLCVHAGVWPGWEAAEALARADEVAHALRGQDWQEALGRMYGQRPARWSEGLASEERFRFIVNAFTRMRFCTPTGELDLEVKEGAAVAPPGLLPWFDVPGRRTAGVPVAFGHWSTLGLVVRPDLLALDTGCVWGGCLSAARVDGGRCDILTVRCKASRQPGQDG